MQIFAHEGRSMILLVCTAARSPQVTRRRFEISLLHRVFLFFGCCTRAPIGFNMVFAISKFQLGWKKSVKVVLKPTNVITKPRPANPRELFFFSVESTTKIVRKCISNLLPFFFSADFTWVWLGLVWFGLVWFGWVGLGFWRSTVLTLLLFFFPPTPTHSYSDLCLAPGISQAR